MRAAIGRTEFRLWRQNSGLFLSLDGKRKIRAGVNGCGDLSGILNDGRRLEVEIKTFRPGSEQFAQQRAFEAMIARFGGVYIVARSAGDFTAKINSILAARS